MVATITPHDDGDGFAVSLDRRSVAWPVRVELHDDDETPAVRHLSFAEATKLRDAIGEAICSQFGWGRQTRVKLEAAGDLARNRVGEE